MAKKEPQTVRLPQAIATRLLAMENEKRALLASVAQKEREQMAMLTGAVGMAGVARFDPLEWDLGKIAEGSITRILDANGRPVEVLGTDQDLARMLEEHAQTGKPTLLRREVA